MRLRVPEEVRASYRIPGQFLRIQVDDDREGGGFYAIANAPGQPELELLIRRGDPLSDRLASLPPGASLCTSEVLGKGFPIEASQGHDLLLFATGSGIAPIRASLQAIAAERERYGDVHLFFGVRYPEDFPYCDEAPLLSKHGIQLHRAISRIQPTGRGRHARYVQEAFAATLPSVDDAVAFLCGREEMIQRVRETLRGAGMPAERIHLNL